MPRNGSGSYSLPAGNPVSSGTLIEASWANTTLSDLASAMTDSLARSGEGGMTGPLRAADGTVSTPSVSFVSETATGFYRAGATDVRFVMAGVDVATLTTAGVTVGSTKVLALPDGTAAAPALTNTGDTNTGVFFPDADTVGVSTGGTERVRVDSSGNLGLGVTPSAWGSGFKAAQLGAVTSLYNTGNNGVFGVNTYNDGTDSRYLQSSAAAGYFGYINGAWTWGIAPSGTAGDAISFTQAMTLRADGDLLVGTTSGIGVGAKTNIYSATGNGLHVQSGSAAADNIVSYDSAGIPRFSVTNGGAITSWGDLLVGGTSMVSSGKALIQWDSSSGVEGLILYDTDSTAVGRFAQKFNRNGTVVGSIQTTLTATSYVTSSDRRLKDNIVPAPSASDVIDAIEIVSHDWKSTPNEHVTYGVIAQDLALVAPQAVTQGDDGEEIEKAWGVDYSKLVPMLIKEIQSLRARVAQLEAQS